MSEAPEMITVNATFVYSDPDEWDEPYDRKTILELTPSGTNPCAN